MGGETASLRSCTIFPKGRKVWLVIWSNCVKEVHEEVEGMIADRHNVTWQASLLLHQGSPSSWHFELGKH